MKGKSLSIQIWLWFTAIIVGVSMCLSIVFYVALERFFEEQVYTQIEAQQKEEIVAADVITGTYIEAGNTDITDNIPALDIIPATNIEVQHAFVPMVEVTEATSVEYTDLEMSFDLLPSIQTEIIEQAKQQNDEIVRYEKSIGSETLMYVISKQQIENQPMVIYSFVWENFNSKILSQFWFVFVGIIGISLVLLFPARIVANRITKPLIILEGDMQRIANRDWHQPIHTTGPKEVSNLSESCERMRQQLIIHDQNQQALLQNISHELKTPIMVIRSYLQAMKDGYNPKGSLEGTVDAIDLEAQRLQKKTLDLIYITNLEYMAHQKRSDEMIDLKSIVTDVYERVKYTRSDVQWALKLDEAPIKGDPELWKVVFENLLQNQIRYSKEHIGVEIDKNDKNIEIRISNDGPVIDTNQFEKLFVAFEKGQDGESGLGLAIVKRIVDMHEGRVWAENLSTGVMFCISIPLNTNL